MDSLKNIREKNKLSQTDFAKRIGISIQRYNSYEKGRRNIPLYIAKKIAIEFNVSLDEIFLDFN